MPLESVDVHKKSGKEGFTPTPDEVRTIQEKMKDPEFMKLMSEYMESLQDPEYRREEEEYLNQIEQEARTQGDYSFDFIFPKEVFYVELLDVGSSKRVFVNICSCEKVEPYEEQTTGDRMGSNWNVPISVGREREDPINNQDGGNAADRCVVFDAVFHPTTIALAERSDRFQTFLVEIAVENINGGYSRKFGYKYRRCCNSSSERKAVGTPANQTIKKEGGTGKLPVSSEPVSTAPHNFKNDPSAAVSKGKSTPNAALTPTLPSHTIAHRGTIDMSDAWNWKVSEKRIGVPKELVVKLDFSTEANKTTIPASFPGVKQASWLDLEVSTDGTVLELHPDAEKRHPFGGHIVLPFTVETDPSSAKFDRQKCILTVVLVVIPSFRPDDKPPQTRDVVVETPPVKEETEAVETVTAQDDDAFDMMKEARQQVEQARAEREANEKKMSATQPISPPISEVVEAPSAPQTLHDDQEEKPEIVDLRNKQREWLNAEKARTEKQDKSIQDAINELSKIVEDDEDEVNLKREQDAKAKKALRDQQRKELAEKECERLEMKMREKMAELPLKSSLIFEIE